MFYIRQGATHKVVIGPAVAVGDGFTPVTTLDLSTADEAEVILHDNGTVVSISAYTFAAITTADGYYHLTLQSGISGTVGHMTVVINDDSLILPLRADFTILEEAVYDAMFAASAPGFSTVAALATAQADLDTLTGADGATLATTQGNYAPAKAGDLMGLANDAITAAKYDETTAFPLTAVDGSTLTEAGGTGDHLTALGTAAELAKVPKSDSNVTWNATALASINTQAGLALSDYDPPTKAELDTAVDALPTAAENATAVFTTAMTESYRSANAAGTLAQYVHEIIAHLGEFAIAGTTKTTKKLDGSTTAKVYTLNDATSPTSITETT